MIQNDPCCISTNNETLKLSLDCITSVLENHNTINRDSLESILQVVAVNLKTLISQYEEKSLDEGHFQILCDRIRDLDHTYQENHFTIHTLYETALKGLYRRAISPTNLIHKAAASCTSWAWQGITSTLSYFTPKPIKDHFVDNNHPWKQKKYQLNIQMMIEAFAVDFKKDIHVLLEEVSLYNEFESPLRNSVLDLLHFLINPYSSPRSRYTKFMTKLRETLMSRTFLEERRKKEAGGTPTDPCVDILLKFCCYRFSSVHIYTFCRGVVNFMIQEGNRVLAEAGKSLHPPSSLAESLGNEFKAIERAPAQAPKLITNKNKLQGTLNIGFDPHMNTNMPYALYQIALDSSTGHATHALRIGTPTQQRYNYETMTWQGEADIVPEFENFVWALAHVLHKKLLHISLQDDTERSMFTESERTKALKVLQNSYPQNFFVAILAQDSSFYYQLEAFSKTDDAQLFKVLFLTELFSENKGYYFPPAWKQDPVFLAEIKRLLDAVHADVFANRTKLDLAERLDFIEIYYARLTLYILQYTKIDYFFFCCKDSVDRAAKSNALLLYLIMILQRSETRPENIEMLHVYVHAAAMLVKKQAMNVGRRQRFLSALDRMDKAKEHLRKWSAEFPNLGAILVIQPPNQEIGS